MIKSLKRSSWITTVLVPFLLLISFAAYNQTTIILGIDTIRDENFPSVELGVSVLDSQGFPIKYLTKDNFSLAEDQIPIDNFDVEVRLEHPLELAFVIDTSESTGFGQYPPLISVTQAVQEFLASLSDEDRAAIISFSDKISTVDLTLDKNLLREALSNLKSAGNARLNDALMEAIGLFNGSTGRHVIILFADGPDSGLSRFSFVEVINEAVRQKVVFYPIAWGGASRENLEKLADLTRGELQFLPENQPDPNAFQAALNNLKGILPDLRVQYHIRFVSGLIADGKEHDLSVKVDYLGQHIESSRQFNAVPGVVTVSLPGFQDGQEVGSLVRFVPEIKAPAQVKQLEVFIDGVASPSATSESFEFIWDSSKVSPGLHELTFVATDMANNRGEISLTLNVKPAVTVALTSPSEGETISETTLITARAEAPFSRVAKVDFYVDGNLLETDPEPPYEVQWDLSNVVAGKHTIKAIAVEQNGAESEPMEINVNVSLGGFEALWLVILMVVAVTAVLIPLATRGRRRKRQAEAAPSGAGLAGSTRQSGQAFLRELEGLNPGKLWALSETEVRLGRKRDENDIPLKGTSASRQQAAIRFYQGHYILYNLSQKHPILVNGSPVNQQQVLQPNDVLRAGESELRFEIQG